MALLHAVQLFLYVVLIQQCGWWSECNQSCLLLVKTVQRNDFSALLSCDESTLHDVSSDRRVSFHKLNYVIDISIASVKSEFSGFACQKQNQISPAVLLFSHWSKQQRDISVLIQTIELSMSAMTMLWVWYWHKQEVEYSAENRSVAFFWFENFSILSLSLFK